MKEQKLRIKNIILIFFSIFSLINIYEAGSCGFNIEETHKIHKVDQKESRFLQPSFFQPIRIFIDYTTLNAQTEISSDIIQAVTSILTNAQSLVQSLVSVQQSQSKLIIKECTSSITISSIVQNEGVDADLILFPFVNTTVTGTTEAYAQVCTVSNLNHRPLAGLIGFTTSVNTKRVNWLQYFTVLTLHEITHILVFDPQLFYTFIDSNGKTIPSNEITTNQIVNGVNRTLIITPKVVAAAQKHFNCSTLIGVELQDLGKKGTRLTHWQARIMLNDYMIGELYDDTSISEITLALMEDSGWYKVNYYTGGLFRYGKQDGCGFLNTSCIVNGVASFPDVFCNTKNAYMCTASRQSKGFCYITTENPIISEPNYVYFNNNSLGGLQLPDYCPVSQVPTNNTYAYPWNCNIGFSIWPKDFEENISSSSACFISNLLNNGVTSKYSQQTDNLARAMCYQYTCNFNNLTITVFIGITSVNCPTQGGITNAPGYTGTLSCPDFNQVCTSQTRCNNLIDCVNNKITPLNNYYTYQKNNSNALYSNSNNASNLINNTIIIPNGNNSDNQTNKTIPNNQYFIFVNYINLVLISPKQA